MKWTRKYVMALLAGLLVVLAGCAGSGVPQGFDQGKVVGQARQVITQLSERRFDEVEAQFSPEMRTSLNAQSLKTALEPTLDKLGAFQAFESETAGSGENSAIGKYAVTVIRCRYEKGTATYTISIDSAGQVCGLYMR